VRNKFSVSVSGGLGFKVKRKKPRNRRETHLSGDTSSSSSKTVNFEKEEDEGTRLDGDWILASGFKFNNFRNRKIQSGKHSRGHSKRRRQVHEMLSPLSLSFY
jgi:hypothetical protein